MTGFQKLLISLLSAIFLSLIILCFLMGSDWLAYDASKLHDFCKNNQQPCDAISVAYQLGRLDLVSVSLAIIGVVVGLSVILGFIGIKEKSEFIAAQIASDKMDSYDEMVEKRVQEAIRKHIGSLSRMESEISPQTSAQDADMIKAVDDDE